MEGSAAPDFSELPRLPEGCSISLVNFSNLMTKFLVKLNGVYPEHEGLFDSIQAVELLAKTESGRETLCEKYYDAVKDDLDDLNDKVLATLRRVVNGNIFLQSTGIPEFLDDPSFADSIPIVFAYVNKLNTLARLVHQVSPEMMQAMEDVGRMFSEDLRSGRVQTIDLEAIGQRVVDRLKEKHGDKPERWLTKQVSILADIMNDSDQFSQVFNDIVAAKSK